MNTVVNNRDCNNATVQTGENNNCAIVVKSDDIVVQNREKIKRYTYLYDAFTFYIIISFHDIHSVITRIKTIVWKEANVGVRLVTIWHSSYLHRYHPPKN